MRSIIFTVLVVCFLSFSVFGQTARKVYEFGEQISIKADIQNIRDTELEVNPTAKLYIINYGTPILVEKRLKQLNKAFDFLAVDRMRVEIAPPISNPFLMTEFWIVPEGAENPKPTNYAEKFDEARNEPFEKLLANFTKFYNQLAKKENSTGYIVNFGTKKQKTTRLRQLNKAFSFMPINIDRVRIIIVDGGYSKTIKTEFWIVPPKSEK
jgi:hypothetical protein